MAVQVPSDVRPYQRVDGLESIYVGLGSPPVVTWVFETAKKMSVCKAALVQGVPSLSSGRGRLCKGGTSIKLLGTRQYNLARLSPTHPCDAPEERVLTCTPDSRDSDPIRSTHELLEKCGTLMQAYSPSKNFSAVPIYGVDVEFEDIEINFDSF